MNGQVWLRRLWVLGGLLGVALAIYLSLRPHPQHMVRVGRESGHFEHFLAYTLLMFWWCQGLGERGARAFVWAGLVVLASGLEVAQLFTPDRTFELADIAVGGIAAATGWLLAPPRTPNLIGLGQRLLRPAPGA